MAKKATSPITAHVAHLLTAYRRILADTEDNLRRYSAEQIERSATLTRRARQVEHYKGTIADLERLETKTPDDPKPEKGNARLVLAHCPEHEGGCGYKARVSMLWLQIGILRCPNADCPRHEQEFTVEWPASYMASKVRANMELVRAARNGLQDAEDINTMTARDALDPSIGNWEKDSPL